MPKRCIVWARFVVAAFPFPTCRVFRTLESRICNEISVSIKKTRRKYVKELT